MTTVAIATGLSWRTAFNILKLFTPDNTYLILQDSMIGLVHMLTKTPLIDNKLKDKPPTTANKMDEIKDWLRQHKIHFKDHEIKWTVLEKDRQNRPEP